MRDHDNEGLRSIQRTNPVRRAIQARAKLPQTKAIHDTSGMKSNITLRKPLPSMPRRGTSRVPVHGRPRRGKETSRSGISGSRI